MQHQEVFFKLKKSSLVKISKFFCSNPIFWTELRVKSESAPIGQHGIQNYNWIKLFKKLHQLFAIFFPLSPSLLLFKLLVSTFFFFWKPKFKTCDKLRLLQIHRTAHQIVGDYQKSRGPARRCVARWQHSNALVWQQTHRVRLTRGLEDNTKRAPLFAFQYWHPRGLWVYRSSSNPDRRFESDRQE